MTRTGWDTDCAGDWSSVVCSSDLALAPGASKTYQLTLAVAPGFAPGTGALVNTAKIDSTPVTDPDRTSTRLNSSHQNNAYAASDLSITKNDHVGFVVAGTSTTYDI